MRDSEYWDSPVGNPFSLPDECELFGFKEASQLNKEAEKEKIRHMSLIDRADTLRPRIRTPYSPSQQSRAVSVCARSEVSEPGTKIETKNSRSQRITEFIQQKREVFLMQLLIDKKNEEISKVNRSIQVAERNFEDNENAIDDTMQKFKQYTTKFEVKLAKKRKQAEAALCERVELQKRKRQVIAHIQSLRSDMSKSEELLENYKQYHDFLQFMTPDGKEIFEYYTDPDMLPRDLDKIEQGNLLLFNKCNEISDYLNSGKAKMDSSIRVAESALEQLEPIPTMIPPDDINKMIDNTQINFNKVDEQLSELSKKVIRAYYNCFKENSDINPLAMLAKIENTLEKFYSESEVVDQSYIAAQQAIRDKERREKNRAEMQAEKERLQNEKKEAALERARKPIPKRTGRPVYARSTVGRVKHRDDEKKRRAMEEKRRMEELLFGPTFTD